jgi:ABC-2 type transport system ATP-binding protein
LIQLTDCSRWYGQVIGINDINVEIGSGVTALLGQNGAGKSTMMRLITGQLRPTTGEISVFGEDPFANPNVFRRLGYVPDIDSFPEHLSGRGFVRRMAAFRKMNRAEAESRTEEVLKEVGMADRADRKIGGYSKGMRQRIKLAQAMLHDPEIILLDEPLNGLDPVGRHEYMSLLARLSAQNRAIIVSSHILFEVEQMTQSILLLHRGRLLAAGDIQTIRNFMDRHPRRVRVQTAQPREAAAFLISRPFVDTAIVRSEDELEVQTRKADQFFEELPQLSLEHGIDVYGFYSPDEDLESVYRYLVQ